METPRTESELREFYQDFSIGSLKFAIALNSFLRFFCTEFGLFLMYLIILSIPMVIFYERVLQHPLFFGFLFVGLQAACFAYSRRNLEKLQNDIDTFNFENSVFEKMVSERK